jgi:hypothetical protein
MKTEFTFSKRQIEYLSGGVRGEGISPIPETCPAHLRERIIERRAKHYGIKPSLPVAIKELEMPAAPKAAPAYTPGRFLRPTL